jgi:hypothetical protein
MSKLEKHLELGQKILFDAINNNPDIGYLKIIAVSGLAGAQIMYAITKDTKLIDISSFYYTLLEFLDVEDRKTKDTGSGEQEIRIPNPDNQKDNTSN